jgi:mlo protein
MKKAIFEEQTAKALQKWQKAARERRKMRKAGGGGDVPTSGFMSGENTPSHGSISPIHLLHKHKTNSTTTHNDIESVVSSPRAYHSETELSETEGPARLSADDLYEPTRSHRYYSERNIADTHNGDFSFVKP